MKLNLPSTWTSEKITSLIFLTWLSANQVNAGQAFNNCLIDYNNAYNKSSYNLLLNYPFESQTNITDGGLLRICCSDIQCSSTPFNLHCKKYVLIDFFCNKLSSGIFCKFGFGCGGMVGDTPITTNTTFREGCAYHNVSLATMADYLVTVPLANFTGLEHGYALYIWPRSSSFPRWDNCGWDNGGWTCAFVSMDTDKDCRLQWPAPWPGSAENNPFPLSVTTSVSSTVSTTPLPENNPQLAEKIAIPIGTAVGVGSASGLAYYFWKKRKKVALDQTETDSVELLVFKEPEVNINETLAVQADSSTPNTQPQIAQQVINPNQPRQVSINFTIPAWLNKVF